MLSISFISVTNSNFNLQNVGLSQKLNSCYICDKILSFTCIMPDIVLTATGVSVLASAVPWAAMTRAHALLRPARLVLRLVTRRLVPHDARVDTHGRALGVARPATCRGLLGRLAGQNSAGPRGAGRVGNRKPGERNQCEHRNIIPNVLQSYASW